MLLLDHFLVVITTATEHISHIHEEGHSYTQRRKRFHQLKRRMVHLGGKTLYIIASSIISMYDIDKTQNIILNMP